VNGKLSHQCLQPSGGGQTDRLGLGLGLELGLGLGLGLEIGLGLVAFCEQIKCLHC